MQLRNSSRKIRFLLVGTLLLFGFLSLDTNIPAASAAPESQTANELCRFFNETNNFICGRFLKYWDSHGGLAQQGFPISRVFLERNAPPPAGDGQIHPVQYFERARFEYHLENDTPYDILLGLLGGEQYKARYGDSKPASQPQTGNCRNFSETGFKICGKFLTYWESHGGLVQQGFPISEVFDETNAPPPAGDGKIHRVQYFERARFEEHLENSPPNDVLLGLLGGEQVQVKYTGNTPGREPVTILGVRVASSLNGVAPSNGSNLVIIDLQISNNSDSPTLIDLGKIALITPDDKAIPVNVALTKALPNGLAAGTYPANTFEVGEVVFVVPKDIQTILTDTIGYQNDQGTYTKYKIY